jgi:hypothetical protein
LVDRVPIARNRYFLTIVALHNLLKSTALFRVGTWFGFAAAVCALAWRGRGTAPGAFAISIVASGIAYVLSFGVFGVAADFRYAYWCVLASFAGLVPAVLARRNQRSKPTSQHTDRRMPSVTTAIASADASGGVRDVSS